VTDRPVPPPAATPPATASEDDADRWREAARLRREHPKWVIVWVAPAGEFRAYRRLPGTRRDTALSAATAHELDGLITQAEQAARAADGHTKDRM
jgi:hypothetical protein